MRLAKFEHINFPDENGIVTTVNDYKYKYDDFINVLKTQIKNNEFTIPLYGNVSDFYYNDKVHIIGEAENILFHDNTFDIECQMFQYNDLIDFIESKFKFGIISAYHMIDKDIKFIKIESIYGFQLIQTNFDEIK